MDMDEWTAAWSHKMDDFQKLYASRGTAAASSSASSSSSSSSSGDGPLLCAYCGWEEAYLGTQFVLGQTWQEFEREQDPTTASTRYYHTGQAAS